MPKTAAPNHPFDHGTFEIVREPWPDELLVAAQSLAAAKPGDPPGWISSPA